MEDYLEMIYRNIENNGFLRVHKLADMLNVRTSSATKMVQKLAASGYLKYEKYGVLQPTKKGEKAGRFLLKRHNIIETFLRNIGVFENILKETELIEHNISLSTLKKIEKLNALIEQFPDFSEKLKNI